MAYLFTSESVSEGHPDKVADQISDALLDEFLRYDPNSKVACETLVTTGLVVCSGEVRTEGWVEIQDIVRRTLREIGYTHAEYQFEADSCGIISTIHEQSSDIRQGVNREKPEDQGAGDQGMMFGYACREQDNLMPFPVELAHDLLYELSQIRRENTGIMPYLRPDAKSQVTMLYDDNGKPEMIDTIVISTQHDEYLMPECPSDKDMSKYTLVTPELIKADVIKHLIPRLLKRYKERDNNHVERLFPANLNDLTLHVNPTGKFVIGGPHGDTGLTGRKIIVDTYGGRGAHGGGAFSGKDSSKVDRSAAYAARHIAKNLVAAGVADEVLVQVAYAIGVARPVGVYINTFGSGCVKDSSGNIISDGELARKVAAFYDFRPYFIVKRFGLTNPIFNATASYGHFGQNYQPNVEVEVYYDEKVDPSVYTRVVDGKTLHFKKVDFFGWEKLDLVDDIKKTFGI